MLCHEKLFNPDTGEYKNSFESFPFFFSKCSRFWTQYIISIFIVLDFRHWKVLLPYSFYWNKTSVSFHKKNGKKKFCPIIISGNRHKRDYFTYEDIFYTVHMWTMNNSRAYGNKNDMHVHRLQAILYQLCNTYTGSYEPWKWLATCAHNLFRIAYEVSILKMESKNRSMQIDSHAQWGLLIWFVYRRIT